MDKNRIYSLWLDKLEDVKDYERRFFKLTNKEKEKKKDEEANKTVHTYKVCKPLSFNVNKIPTTKLSMYDIDSLTTGYFNQAELLTALADPKYSGYYITQTPKNPLIATYVHKERSVRQIPIIYNSPLLGAYARHIRSLEETGQYDDTCSLKNCDELEKMTDKFLALVESKNLREYVLRPQHLPEYVLKKDKESLSKALPPTKIVLKSYNNKVKREYEDPLHYRLINYKEQYDLYSNRELTKESKEKLQLLRREVNIALRSNYQSFRNSILFLKELEQVLEKNNKNTNLKEDVMEEVSIEYKLFTEINEGKDTTLSLKKLEYLNDIKENDDILKSIAINNQSPDKIDSNLVTEDYLFEEKDCGILYDTIGNEEDIKFTKGPKK